MAAFAGLIRDVPDFPKAGILFKDIMPLLANADGFRFALGGRDRWDAAVPLKATLSY